MKAYTSTWFVEITLDDSSVRLCNAFVDTTFDSQTYLGMGDRFQPPRRTRREATLKSQRINVTFDSSRQLDDGNDPIADLLDAQWRRRQVRLRQVLTEPGQTPDQGDVIVDERGRIRDLSDRIAVGEPPRIELSIESGTLAYLERRMQTRTPANQKAIFPDDEGFDLSINQFDTAQYLTDKRISSAIGRFLNANQQQAANPFGSRSGQEVADPDTPPARELLLGQFGTEGSFVLSNTYGENENGNAIYQVVIALADCQLQELTAIYAGGVKQNASPLAHGVRTELRSGDLWTGDGRRRNRAAWATFFDGRYNQTAPTPTFQGDIWGGNRVLKGVAYVIFETYDGDGSASTPSLWFTGKGARLYDRRKDTTAGGSGAHRLSDPTTWEYSSNPMVAIDHYRAGRVVTPTSSAKWFGVGEAIDAMPYAEFQDLADYCDESVDLKAGGTQKRFEVGGSLSAADDHKKNLEKLALAMGGRVIDQGGRLAVRDSRVRTSVMTITDGDLLSSATSKVSPTGRFDDLANTIEGRFNDELNRYRKNDYARVTNSNYVDEDGDEIIDTRTFDLETNGERAQRLAKLELARSRRVFEIEEEFALDFVRPLAPGDWYVRQSALRGFASGKTFEVDRIERREDGSALVVGLEVDPAALAWTETEAADLLVPPAYALVTLPAIPAPVVTLQAVELSANGVTTPGVTFDVTALDPFDTRLADLAEVEFGPHDGTDFTGTTEKRLFDPEDPDGFTYAGFLPSTQYGFRFRGRSGRRLGAWSSVQTVTTTANSTSTEAGVVLWSNVSGTGRPDDNADVTGDNTAAAITGQGPWATEATPVGVLTNPGTNMMAHPSGGGSGAAASALGWASSGGDTSGSGLYQGAFADFGGPTYQEDFNSGYSSGSPRFHVYDVIASPIVGSGYTVSVIGSPFGLTNCAIYLDAIDSGGAFISAGSGALLNGARNSGTITAPTGAAKIRIVVIVPAQTVAGYCNVNFRQIKVEAGGTATAYGNDRIDAEPGANVTETRTAAAITGQGGNATTSTYYQGTAPSSPVNGDFWADTSAGALKFRNAGAWEIIADIAPSAVNFTASYNASPVNNSGSGASFSTGSIAVNTSGLAGAKTYETAIIDSSSLTPKVSVSGVTSASFTLTAAGFSVSESETGTVRTIVTDTTTGRTTIVQAAYSMTRTS